MDDQSDAYEQLLDIQREQRAAHLTADAPRLVALFGDDFVTIANGTMSRPTRQASIQRTQAYLDRVTFLAWEDLTPPDIRLSWDATLATVIVHKRVHVQFKDDAGQPAEEETIFVWHETYARRDDRWQLVTVVSTNAPATNPVGAAAESDGP